MGSMVTNVGGSGAGCSSTDSLDSCRSSDVWSPGAQGMRCDSMVTNAGGAAGGAGNGERKTSVTFNDLSKSSSATTIDSPTVSPEDKKDTEDEKDAENENDDENESNHSVGSMVTNHGRKGGRISFYIDNHGGTNVAQPQQ